MKENTDENEKSGFGTSLEDQARQLLTQAKSLNSKARRLEEEAREKIKRHYGLVQGETLLRSLADDTYGWTGRYLELVNYRKDEKPWVRVRLEPVPQEKKGGGGAQNFFGNWEIVEDRG